MENGKREHVVKRRFFSFFQKPDVAGAVNGTRACIHAEIMEIDGDDFVRGEVQQRAEMARRTEERGWQTSSLEI